jgi:hypothetical protein
MADQQRVIRRNRRGQAAGWAGSEAGEGAKYDELAEEQERTRYRRAHGVSGIGGASKLTPDFLARESEHLRQWRKKRQAEAAKKRGRKKAAEKLPKPKPSPSPTPENE